MLATLYQQQAKETAVYPEYARVLYPLLGICGEVGEVVDAVCSELWPYYKNHSSAEDRLVTRFDLIRLAGRDCELLKKQIRDGEGYPMTVSGQRALQTRIDGLSDVQRRAIKKEVGDVCWYLASLCDDLGLDLGEVMAENLSKLAKRKAAGTIQGSGDDR